MAVFGKSFNDFMLLMMTYLCNIFFSKAAKGEKISLIAL